MIDVVDIIALAAIECIGPAAAIENVIAVSSDEIIGVVPTINGVISQAAVDLVDTGISVERIGSNVSEEVIISSGSFDEIAEQAAIDVVSQAVSCGFCGGVPELQVFDICRQCVIGILGEANRIGASTGGLDDHI